MPFLTEEDSPRPDGEPSSPLLPSPVFHSGCHDAPERTAEFENALNIIQKFRGMVVGVETLQEKRGTNVLDLC
jgi:hypothetical protein